MFKNKKNLILLTALLGLVVLSSFLFGFLVMFFMSPAQSKLSNQASVSQPPFTSPSSSNQILSPSSVAVSTLLLSPTALPVPPSLSPLPVPPSRPTLTVAIPTVANLAEVLQGELGKKQVAITIDAGGESEPFPKMLRALEVDGIKLTFFLTGQWAQQNPTYVAQFVQAGHELANHSWSHIDFTTLSDEKIKEELEKTDQILAKFSGRSTKPLMRFPYGSRNSHIMQVVNNLGYRSIFWTLDSLDSVGQPKTAQFLIKRITEQSDAELDGQIILMHVLNPSTAEALPIILENLKNRGFKIVTVSKLLSN